jgi:inorganic triphosphatase YgiF
MADEVEAKLLVLGEDREATVDAIAALDTVAGLIVVWRREHALTDAYFETPDHGLAAHGVALRVRSQDGEELLTVKGDARVQDGVISRFELEVAWSTDGLDRVLSVLRDAGVALTGNADQSQDAMSAMASLGLVAASPRTNRRTALGLAALNGEHVAELDIDRVVFSAGGHRVRHFEVECEARAGAGPELLRAVAEDLCGRFDGLRPISYSKLELGQLLDAWAAEGALASWLDGDQLTGPAYDEIERRLG